MKSFNQTKHLENVYYDISSLWVGPKYLEKYPNAGFASRDTAIEYVIALLSECPHKVLFGTDYGSLSMREQLDMILCANLSSLNFELLMFANANNIYNLDL